MPAQRPSGKKAVPTPRNVSAPSRRAFSDRLTTALDRHAAKIAIALVLLATLRIVATYSVFSHTTDEPAHLACGMEWLERGVYRMEAQHPPLARVAAALGPYLMGRHFHYPEIEAERLFISGVKTYDETDYDATLAASRFGILPFFWVASFVVYLWAKRDFGPSIAVAALFLFTFVPSVLAHAGLATTDMALTAFLGAAFLAGRAWLERPSPKSGALFGAAGALAVVSKFSSLPYFAAAAGLAIVFYAVAGRIPIHDLPRALKQRLPSFGVALAVGFTILWAAYRFSFGPVDFAPFPLPAPEFYKGIQDVVKHNREGHLSYQLGNLSRDGFRAFYFVVLAVKTPLAFLALAGFGIAAAARKWKDTPEYLLPAAYALGIVAVSFFSRINIGVRHILPIYTPLSIFAAAGIIWLLDTAVRRRWAGAAVAVLLGWYALSSLLSHPDYLPYFNELAGGHPEKILVDSDLDWGQDMKRLEARIRAGGARLLTLAVLTRVSERTTLPPLRKVNPETPLAGWTAVGFTAWKQYRLGLNEKQPEKAVWPERYPPHEIVGKSIAVWYFPPSSGLPLQ